MYSDGEGLSLGVASSPVPKDEAQWRAALIEAPIFEVRELKGSGDSEHN